MQQTESIFYEVNINDSFVQNAELGADAAYEIFWISNISGSK